MKTIIKYQQFVLPQVFVLVSVCSFCQIRTTDTVFNKTAVIEEVVVTATRTQKSIGDIPVPVQVISKNFIRQTGSQKLIDILQQQTGLVLADNPLGQALQGYPNPFGSGIQMQGLDPAYTLILLDGEPLTGRNAGVLNLGRVAVGNIKQIEIVKGPATSLYGSDALAGVINIITEKPKSNDAGLQIHQAGNGTLGFTANAMMVNKSASLQLFANRYSSKGYDLDKSIYGKTADPFNNYSFSVKLIKDFNANTCLQSSARLFTQKQFNNYQIYSGSQPDVVTGNSNETDWSIDNQLQHRFSGSINLISRLYLTGYENNSAVYLQKENSLFDRSFLHQFLLKPELQLEIGKKQNQKLISGTGYYFETIDANRYASKKELNTRYLFFQKEWLPFSNLNITAGIRADKNSYYKTQISPKLAISFKPVKQFTLMGSVGTGFKAPDFRQQFLAFTNSLIGYTLLGANELNNGLAQLKLQGQIDPAIDISPYLIDHTLLAEKSVGINLGFRYQVKNTTTITSNFFNNNIKNLIDRYNLPFTKINNQAIYSYININKVFTRGFDINIRQQLLRLFEICGGYQYLDAKDKDVLKNIKENKLVKRDPVTYVSSYVTIKDYGGLFNRSRHSANLQLLYSNKHHWFTASVRANYRGRFGFSDITGDNILNDDREYVKGYVLLNTTLGISPKKGIQIQTGCENILNHIDKDKLPNLSGRIYFINCNIELTKLFPSNKKTTST
jgi:outer membrane receptor for ferrienterochelin and colicins